MIMVQFFSSALYFFKWSVYIFQTRLILTKEEGGVWDTKTN